MSQSEWVGERSRRWLAELAYDVVLSRFPENVPWLALAPLRGSCAP